MSSAVPSVSSQPTAQLPSLPDFLMAGGSEQQWLEAQKNGMLNVQADSDDNDAADRALSGEADEELLLDPATAEATAAESKQLESDGASSDSSSSNSEEEEDDTSDSDSSDSDDSSDEDEDMEASGSSSSKAAAASSSANAAPSSSSSSTAAAAAAAASASNLLEDDELLQSRHAPTVSSAGDDSELVEFEIVIDGEVVGTTFLPRRNADTNRKDGGQGEGGESVEAARAKAEALRNQRKRKFHERMGHVEEETPTPSLAAIAAAASADGLFIPSGPTICTSCEKEKTKYRCPKCDTGSCSLACVTAHKTKTGCTGVRSRTAYVPLSKMDDRTLQSDVSFLTEMERQSGASKRDPRMKDTKGDTIRIAKNNNKDIEGKEASESLLSSSSLFSCTPRHLDATSFTLMAACTQFRAIKYMCMPQGMKMHKENQSKVYALKKANNNAAPNKPQHHNNQINLSPSSSVIRWTLHLIFKHRALTTDGPTSDMKIIRKRVDERVTWNQVLDSILSAIPAAESSTKPAPSEKAKQATSVDPPVVAHMSTALLRHQLASFLPPAASLAGDSISVSTSPATPATTSSLFSHLRILYAVPFQPANAPVYYSLDLSSTVLQSLAHKVLVEHPVVLVVHQDDMKSYTVEKEPTPPQKPNKKKPESANGDREERKKRKLEAESTNPDAAANNASMEVDQATPLGVAAIAAESSDVTADSSEGNPHGRGGHFNRGGGGRGGGFSHRGGGRGGHRGGGRGGHNNWNGRGGRGGGGGGRGPHDKSAPPAYSFGVPQQAAAAAKPAPAPTPAPTSTPSLFKKWA